MEVEATLGREAWNRRWLSRYNKTTTNFGKLCIESLHNCWSFLIGTTSLLKGLKSKEENSLIWARAIEAITTHHRCGSDIWLFLKNFGHLKTSFLGQTERGTILQLENSHPIALIFFGNKRRGQS